VDAGILGDGDFIGCMLGVKPEEVMKRRYALLSAGMDLRRVVAMVAEVLGVKPEEGWAEGKYR